MHSSCSYGYSNVFKMLFWIRAFLLAMISLWNIWNEDYENYNISNLINHSLSVNGSSAYLSVTM